MTGKAIRISAAILVAVLLSSCSSYQHRQWRSHDAVTSDSGSYALRFIEVDDEGWFWDRSQADAAVEQIRKSVEDHDTIVVTFVHGWHHCARCCDSNVEGFHETLARLSRLKPQFKIIGLYIGWRGRSLWGPADYLTFWGRKSAAERVGQNDLKEFFARTQALFAELRPDARRPDGSFGQQTSTKFLGWVTIGHSFGAQVVLKSIAESLEDQLIALNPSAAYLRDAVPAQRPGEEYSLSGVGDLIVLINPAAEASQYHRLSILSQGLNYSRLQAPVLLTVSSENDNARHRLFTLGRVLGEFFTGKPHKTNTVERIVERQALGVYPGHVTHVLEPADASMKLVSRTVTGDTRTCANSASCEFEWLTWKKEPTKTREDSLQPEDPRLRNFDFSGEVIFNNVRLAPLSGEELARAANEPIPYGKAQPYQPLIVARASPAIVDNHSGIFTDPFMRFLIPYIAYIEEKSRANQKENTRKRTEQSAYEATKRSK